MTGMLIELYDYNKGNGYGFVKYLETIGAAYTLRKAILRKMSRRDERFGARNIE